MCLGSIHLCHQGLDLPRLVYSTDLSDITADLKILKHRSLEARATAATA